MIEAVCEELEVGAVMCDGGGERIFVFTATNYDYIVVYKFDVVLYHCAAGEKGPFETHWQNSRSRRGHCLVFP